MKKNLFCVFVLCDTTSLLSIREAGFGDFRRFFFRVSFRLAVVYYFDSFVSHSGISHRISFSNPFAYRAFIGNIS